MPKLKLIARGKVRDIYAMPDSKDDDKLLFVATDRISAFDIIMDNVSWLTSRNFGILTDRGFHKRVLPSLPCPTFGSTSYLMSSLTM
jgi:hypothetical protein